MFALVSDPATNGQLSADERAAVDAFVPWTRIVSDGRTTDWDGREVDLLEFAASAREQLVVKPATDYGGSGVVLGWLTEPSRWEAALRTARDRASVLQRRLTVPIEPFPRMVDGRIELL